MGQDADAVETLRLAVHSNPNYAAGHVYLAAAEALVGNVERAAVHLAQLDELDPGMTIKRFVEERSPVPREATSQRYRGENERIMEGLRRAGLADG
jgi:hypothetical protein